MAIISNFPRGGKPASLTPDPSFEHVWDVYKTTTTYRMDEGVGEATTGAAFVIKDITKPILYDEIAMDQNTGDIDVSTVATSYDLYELYDSLDTDEQEAIRGSLVSDLTDDFSVDGLYWYHGGADGQWYMVECVQAENTSGTEWTIAGYKVVVVETQAQGDAVTGGGSLVVATTASGYPDGYDATTGLWYVKRT